MWPPLPETQPPYRMGALSQYAFDRLAAKLFDAGERFNLAHLRAMRDLNRKSGLINPALTHLDGASWIHMPDSVRELLIAACLAAVGLTEADVPHVAQMRRDLGLPWSGAAR